MSSLGLFHMQRHVLEAHSSTDLGSSRGGKPARARFEPLYIPPATTMPMPERNECRTLRSNVTAVLTSATMDQVRCLRWNS